MKKSSDSPESQNSKENLPTRKKNLLKKIFLFLFCFLALGYGGFLYWVSGYYPAEDIALEVLADGNFQVQDEFTILQGESEVGILFYPGALVESTAYLPLLQQLQKKGFTTVLVTMPYNLAFFGVNSADKVLEMELGVSEWYIMGHSLGGGMASSYASDNQDKLAGLILLGAYIYGDYPPEKSLTIYGSYNDNLEEKINYTENILKIEGGNHAKFGNYGIQKGDPVGDISHEEQQEITVEAIVDFIQ